MSKNDNKVQLSITAKEAVVTPVIFHHKHFSPCFSFCCAVDATLLFLCHRHLLALVENVRRILKPQLLLDGIKLGQGLFLCKTCVLFDRLFAENQ